MASISSDDSNLSLSSNTEYGINRTVGCNNEQCSVSCVLNGGTNIVNKILNRQLHGGFAHIPKFKTDKLFNEVYYTCRFKLDEIVPLTHRTKEHIFMGFTLCGTYFISYREKEREDVIHALLTTAEYELYIWKFVPGQRLKFVSKHRIFKLLQRSEELVDIKFMQFPADPYKLICYGTGEVHPIMAYISVITLPSPSNCRHCKGKISKHENIPQGWCMKHGFVLHYMFAMSQPCPEFDPYISLAFPDHLVINTGYHIHILHWSSYKPPKSTTCLLPHFIKDEDKLPASHISSCIISDNLSEVSESLSENFGTNSVIDAILEDFSEYDLEGNDCNKPFHELNISCEPLNVTGKSYHNTLIQNIVDPRFKRLQNSGRDCLFSVPQSSGLQKSLEKSKIDKKIAEKAYEFIEENEKCEKLSSFRKKRLADKKYEFSEDNSENIIPFNSLRREKCYLYRSQSRCIRSPDFNNGLFLNPRSPVGLRSPMQSPNSRNGQFSPSSIRSVCCSVRNSPHHSKSPISPRDSARKFNVYSPSLDSDCSDSDSKLVLRQINNFPLSYYVDSKVHSHGGLLVVDAKKDETSRWIKKVVRRYSSGDFENGSLVSGQSRDDCNIPIEIPLLVQTLTDQHLDIVPEFKIDQVTETQLILTQRTFDCEQFIQTRGQKLCADSQLEYRYCEDYEISVKHICPMYGDIVCQVLMKLGAVEASESCGKPPVYIASCMFVWNIVTDRFELIESEQSKLVPISMFRDIQDISIPQINCKKPLVMEFRRFHMSKLNLRDYNNYYEVYINNEDTEDAASTMIADGYYTVSDSD